MSDTEEVEKNEERKERKPGIVYLSRFPPFMKPAKVRHIFSQYGEIGRLFLQPEDPTVRKKRKKSGGSGRKTFTEGWVEFKDKKVAKRVASSLNNTTIGGKKKSYYHDDIWNIKYLPRFLWGQLSEQIAFEKASREQRMRTEISQAKKDANYYIERVEKGKGFEAMEERKRKRNEKEIQEKHIRSFKQHKSLEETKKTEPESKKTKSNETSKLNTSLLSKIFTSKR
ncbi:pre-rRNA-processing protein ESF2 [Exaiptasia diaphana]|uniref:Activator of basal transcription 1 n=1 Tax=Exaiptasia diaphana TaxID=2652724 RepID=A0A913XDA0_EXADI|nr:pre-rRNA-processing protein ESF2 [Exaiptasia diaphana]KXJ26414.1 Pre-rRNA-processing protein ESF2 [Exaiptasia diaphana]